jgi:hypothetical protein
MGPDEKINKIVRTLEAARSKPVTELETGLDEAQLMVVDLRDEYIENLRREADNNVIRRSLDQINMALSMIIGLEYPVGGFQREKIRRAEEVLKGIISGEREKGV